MCRPLLVAIQLKYRERNQSSIIANPLSIGQYALIQRFPAQTAGGARGFFVYSCMRWFLIISFVVAAPSSFAQHPDEIRKSIFFGGGSYQISEDQIAALNHWLDSIPDLLEKFDIHLISHTDPIGGKEYNEWLSRMRSGAVFGLLIQRPVPKHKITIKDWGLENAVYRNDSYEGMVMNRRVDVILYPIIF